MNRIFNGVAWCLCSAALAAVCFTGYAAANETGKAAPWSAERPSGVLSNAAAAAAAAANAAAAAANAANAAANAANRALEALNSVMPASQREAAGIRPLPPASRAAAPLPDYVPEQKLPEQGLAAGVDMREMPYIPTASSGKFAMPAEQTLIGLAGKYEIPVYVDTAREFSNNIAGSTLLDKEPVYASNETNLTESVRSGRSFSRESLAADARSKQASAQTSQALALLLPSVYVKASRGIERSAPSVALDPSTGRPISAETHTRTDLVFTVRQPLFDLPSFLDWRRRKVIEQARSSSYRTSDGDAYLNTVSSYLSLVSTRLQADMTRDFESQLKELLVYVEKRARAGASSVSDMARVRARSQSAISSRLEYESGHTAAGIEFVRLTNVVPKMVRLPELADLGGSDVPETLDKAVTLAMVNNPEISSLHSEMRAAGIDKDAAKSRFLPKLDLEYTDNYSWHAGGDPNAAGQRDRRLMLVLNWSIFSGGGDYYYHRERASRQTELRYRMDDQRRRIVQGLSSNYALLATTRNRISAGYRELGSISVAAEAMSKRMLSGNQSLLDLLDVYDRHYQARMRLVSLHVLEMNTIAQISRLVNGAPQPAASTKTLNIIAPVEKPVEKTGPASEPGPGSEKSS